ncbi:MAG: hypothetical protein IT285_05835 [Bdellovibrionales bacterium]|nr:hypothetical protein [Bdellovibrionales bacterium]
MSAIVLLYAFGWVVPMLLLGVILLGPVGFAFAAALAAGVEFAHRHWTVIHHLGHSEARRRFAPRLWIGGGGAIGIFFGLRVASGLGGRIEQVATTIFAVSAAFFFAHLYLQKLEILRSYANGSPGNEARGISAPLDAFALVAWVPWAVLWPFEEFGEHLAWKSGAMSGVLVPAAQWIGLHLEGAQALAIAGGAAGTALWAWKEWRAERFRRVPRWVMVAGTALATLSFAFVHPTDFLLAMGLAHGLECLAFRLPAIRSDQALAGRWWVRRAPVIGLMTGLTLLFMLFMMGPHLEMIPRSWQGVWLQWAAVQQIWHVLTDLYLWRPGAKLAG